MGFLILSKYLQKKRNNHLNVLRKTVAQGGGEHFFDVLSQCGGFKDPTDKNINQKHCLKALYK